MVARYTDYIVVVDIEALCWENDEKIGRSFPEIIEIGACKLNTNTLEISKKTSYLIKPQFGVVSDFCTRLTTITQDQLDRDGIPFADAVNRIKKEFGTKNRQWASYGEFDKIRFKQQCQMFDVDYPFSDMHRNVKDEYQMMRGWTKGKSVAFVCGELGIMFKGTLHRGDDDAYHIAKILGKIMSFQRVGFNEIVNIPQQRNQAVPNDLWSNIVS